MPDRWTLAVQAGTPVTLWADTIDGDTAADLCFAVDCGHGPLMHGDDDRACTFPPPNFSCPQVEFTPGRTETCTVVVTLCSTQCADRDRARYRLAAEGADLRLIADDGMPVQSAAGRLACGEGLTNRYRFDVAAGQELTILADTVEPATAADLCLRGSCAGGEVFDADDTAECTFAPPRYRCPRARVVASVSGACSVEIGLCSDSCTGMASHRREGGSDLAIEASSAPEASCGNGQGEPGEVCGEPGLNACPMGSSCDDCRCVVDVPDLTGLRADAAHTALEAAGLARGAVTPIVQVTSPPAKVESQVPFPSERVPRGTSVDLAVSLPPDSGEFLTHEGEVNETARSAQAYYDAIDPCGDRDTLDKWLVANRFDGSEPRAVYENHNDLGFGRQMHVRSVAADWVAYYVKNFPTADDAWARPDRLLATVAMEFSRPVSSSCQPDTGQPPFVKFYTFGPDGNRRLSVDLDGRGEKFQPEMCTVCHGGTRLALDGGRYPNRGAIGAGFIPFDLDSFRYSRRNPLFTRDAQLPAFRQLNGAVLAGDSGAVAAAPAARQLIEGWYGGAGLPGDFSGSFVPPAWGSQTELYRRVVQPACRGCHAQLTPSFSTSAQFLAYAGSGGTIEHHVCDDGRMPMARRTFENFWFADTPGRYGPEVLGERVAGGACTATGPATTTRISGPFDSSPPSSGVGSTRAVAVSAEGDVYATGYYSNRVLVRGADGSTGILLDQNGDGTTPLVTPTGIAVDRGGAVFVASLGSDAVFRVAPDGTVTRMLDASGDGVHGFRTPYGDCLGTDLAGNVYVAGFDSDNVFRITPSGVATQIVGPDGDGIRPLDGPYSLAVAADGTVWVGGYYSSTVLRIASDGGISAATAAVVPGPSALAVGPLGAVAVATTDGALRIWPDGSVTPVLDVRGAFGVAFDEADNIYVASPDADSVSQITPGGTITPVLGTPNVSASRLPYDLAIDPRSRVLWVSMLGQNGVLRVDFPRNLP